jgi:hypothetical protein
LLPPDREGKGSGLDVKVEREICFVLVSDWHTTCVVFSSRNLDTSDFKQTSFAGDRHSEKSSILVSLSALLRIFKFQKGV